MCSSLPVQAASFPIACDQSALAVWSFVVDFLHLGIDALALPTQSKGKVKGMRAKVTHDSNTTASFDLPFPTRRLQRIEIATVKKS
jgi:hypothetical protein